MAVKESSNKLNFIDINQCKTYTTYQTDNNFISTFSVKEPSPVSSYHLNILIPTFLVLLGWRIIYLNAKKFATRTESKSLLDTVIKLYDEIDQLAVDFWLGDINEVEPNNYLMLVMSKFETLNNRISDLEKRKVLTNKTELIDYYSALTLNCELIKSTHISVCTENVQKILEKSRKNVSRLYSSFNNTYRPTYNIMNSLINFKR
ncbi:MAG: hypothetical protein HRU18_15775 [Pseudoalteromonas sp.]|uniref:hypothetical protein n=1 Tax=Pseudoalteromonas sp. TaxID=53249 RepID=UPI001DBB3B73|nr:hypothetical protein [Pseudoalteromonas sp.]NRA79666.1 hypothetical protein [Pseudoalteromonas sp.]